MENEGLAVSVLDLVGMRSGEPVGNAIARSVDLAQHVEQWGYRRFWLAEHHSIAGLACSATPVLIGQVAGATSTIRVGSGGVMLPNHAPLVIAEQFGTLASLYPGRIDLGLGRAPGTDMRTAQALRRNMSGGDTFPQDVVELQHYFKTPEPDQLVRAVPGAGLNVPIWLLGSSLFSAQLAAILGLPFAFASHFAPDAMMAALDVYRSQFRPSAQLDRPYAMLGLNICAAATDAEAARLFTSLQQQWTLLRRGNPAPLPPPVDSMDDRWSEAERAGLEHALARAIVGSPETVRQGLEAFIAETGADEI